MHLRTNTTRAAPSALPDWSRRFIPPILVVGRAPLFSLNDVVLYISELSPADQQSSAWQTAAIMLRTVAQHHGDTGLARLAVMRALHRRDVDTKPRRKRKSFVVR